MTIQLDPVLTRLGPFELAWVDLLTAAGVLVAMGLSAVAASRRLRIAYGEAYGLALWGLLGGLVGGRLLHMLEYWALYTAAPWRAIYFWTGGLALWGAIIGAGAAVAARAHLRRLPIRTLADLATLPALAGQAIGRTGDLLTGEHPGRPTSLPWALTYTHPDSPSYDRTAVGRHPAALLEVLWDLLLLILLWRIRRHLRTDGLLFLLYLAGYALGRFLIGFLRTDPVVVLGLQQAQVISVLILLVTGLGAVRWWSRRGRQSSRPAGA